VYGEESLVQAGSGVCAALGGPFRTKLRIGLGGDRALPRPGGAEPRHHTFLKTGTAL
jgi:hypothetical protein